jgi:SAM-dependent methyltransferase
MTIYSGTDNLEVMTEAKNYNAFLLDLIVEPIRPDDCLVDFGAGIGTFAALVKARSHAPICIEPDSAQAQVITTHQMSVVANLDQLIDNGVDYLYTLNVLEHIEDDVAALQAMMPKLKKGARLLIYVPAFPCLFSSMDRKVGHYRRYTKASLISAVQAAGFRVERARYVDSLGFFASYLYKYLGNTSGTLNLGTLIFYDRYVFPLSRILDRLVGFWFGKNVVLLAHKPFASNE